MSDVPYSDIRFCTECGSAAEGMTFCSSCGHRLRPGETAPTSADETRRLPEWPQPSAVPGGGDPAESARAPRTGQWQTTNSPLSWPVPQQQVDLVGNKVLLEPAAVGLLHLVAALWLAWASRDVLSILRYASDLPAEALLSLVAVLATWALIIFGLVKSGLLLLKMRPLGRPLAIVWAVLAFAVATVDGAPGYLFVVALVMALGAATLYLSPWAKAEFTAAEAAAETPTPIAFSLTMVAVLFGLSGLYALALLPLLGQIDAMNAMGELLGAGSVGTKFVLGLLALIVACAAGFIAFRKIQARNVGGRLLVSVLAVVSTVSLWLTFSAVSDAGSGLAGAGGGQITMVKVAGLVVWGGILLPLWLGQVPARWFNTTPIGGVSRSPRTTTSDSA